ncbi:MAG: hypothetical protein A2Z97_06060 [Bdellovibrionales bacterium GWB1_52_6]|nr:MAG: hypothetical protein A2Z97_06060 [Bdellovibrionales bacterium GWB1_52_6]OFZ04339.1 MAG: hypothetical protein A2X97_06750 [Bdellovibrionales bacterium GWA1_52_35]HCM40809.1 monofunctional biosynthetic peptidoglycan transglycosylase [Bdellovibrionales bacterium]
MLRISALLITGLLLLSGCSGTDVSKLKNSYPVVHYRGKTVPARITLQKSAPPDWTSVGQVSRVAIGAIVVSEDWAFYQHGGFDANQMKLALEQDIEERRFARGASTITQQVAKNIFLESDKNIVRKIKELIIAVQLEKMFKKNKILEIYLNIAEWGEGIYGIRAAARHYFGKPPSELSPKEGAFLAMLLPSPKRYSQSFRDKRLTRFAARTVDSILEKMVQAKYLAEEDEMTEKLKPLSFEVLSNEPQPQTNPDPEEDSI